MLQLHMRMHMHMHMHMRMRMRMHMHMYIHNALKKNHEMKPCLNHLNYCQDSTIFESGYFLWSLCCLDFSFVKSLSIAL